MWNYLIKWTVFFSFVIILDIAKVITSTCNTNCLDKIIIIFYMHEHIIGDDVILLYIHIMKQIKQNKHAHFLTDTMCRES